MKVIPNVMRNGLFMSQAQAKRYDLLAKMRRSVRKARASFVPQPDPELEQARRTLAELVPPMIVYEVMSAANEVLETMEFIETIGRINSLGR